MNIKVSSKKVTEVVNGDRMNYDKNLSYRQQTARQLRT